MTTIVAASDLTERSQHVLARAIALAETLKAEVIFVHTAPRGMPELRVEAARARLQEECDLTRGAGGVSVEVLRGRPEIAIPERAAQAGAALVVLGLHRPRAVFDLLRLTTLERIVLRAPAPAIVAHTPPDRPYRNVLAAVDFNAADREALRLAQEIAPGAALHAIHALTLPLREKLPTPANEPLSAPSVQEARARCEAWLREPGLPAGLNPPEIVPGGLHEVLSFRIEELQPELLAIGAGMRANEDRLGNYARDLMREPPTDLLVAKPPLQPDQEKSS